MGDDKRRSPMLTEEDWWTAWFGLFILAVATVLALLTLSDVIPSVKAPKLGKWVSNPVDVLYRASKAKANLGEGTTLQGLPMGSTAPRPRRRQRSCRPRAACGCA